MDYIVSNEMMQAADRYTIDELGIPGQVLMQRAGEACAKIISAYGREDSHKPVAVFCGKGNNGGDGFVIARLLQQQRIPVKVYALQAPDAYQGDAAFHCEYARKNGVIIEHVQAPEDVDMSQHEIIIDAIFGTGLKGEAKGLAAGIINAINNHNATVFAIDIPSGINGNLAQVPATAVRANFTIAIQNPKIAHIMQPSAGYCGDVTVVDIGISDSTLAGKAPRLMDEKEIHLLRPATNANKYTRGEVCLVGGHKSMIGALAYAARTAQTTGAGYVRMVVPASAADLAKILMPGAVSHSLPEAEGGYFSGEAHMSGLFNKSKVVVLGNGMGKSEDSGLFMEKLLSEVPVERPLVIDGDALYYVTQLMDLLAERSVLLTPHYGELRYLFASETIAREPMPVWYELQKWLPPKWVLNLKGSPSVVISQKDIVVNRYGSSALAVAGTGDVLAGLSAALMASQPQVEMSAAASMANALMGLSAASIEQKSGFFAVIPENIITRLPYIMQGFLRD
jgi:hydroxyethylthiazole kinase-like uncharacterized protein yjeF